MSKQHQNQTKTVTSIIMVISTIVLIAGSGIIPITPVNAKKLSDQQRYDSGWKDGARDCGNSDVINSYIQSSAYLGHSDLYHQGYKAAAYDCASDNNNNNNSYPSSHYSSVSAPSTDNQNGYSQNDNNNNRNQVQGQTNTQKVICIVAVGTCGGATSGQSEGLSN